MLMMPPMAPPMAAHPVRDDVRALVAEHLALVPCLVAHVAARYPRHTDREELVQAGRLGLVEAAHRYDPERGVPFDRWASLRIRGAIVDAVRAIDVAPRSLRSSARKVESARAALTSELGRTPLETEVADRTGISIAQLNARVADVHRALVLSLDAPCGAMEGQTLTLADSLVAPSDSDPLCQLEAREQAGYLRDAVTALPSRLRAVVEGYFLEGASSADIADRLGVTESRVSQLRTEALALLRVGLAAQFVEPTEAIERQSVTPQAENADRSLRRATSVLSAGPRYSPDRASARTVAYTAAIGRQRTFSERISPSVAYVPAPRLVPNPLPALTPPNDGRVSTLVPSPRTSAEEAVALSA